jgi:hypothetical protein
MNTSTTDDFFRSRLDQMIELHHPQAVLALRMPWQEIEASIAQCFARQVRQGKKIEDVDLFGGVSALVGGGVSNAGRPRLPLRLMISLLYLKHSFNESDEGLVERWAETPTWQYFSGQEYFEHRWPCDPSLLVRFRHSLGEEGVEQLLASTINVAVTLKLIAKKQLATVIVDSTVMPKAIAHPPTARCLRLPGSNWLKLPKALASNSSKPMPKKGFTSSSRQRAMPMPNSSGAGVKPSNTSTPLLGDCAARSSAKLRNSVLQLAKRWVNHWINLDGFCSSQSANTEGTTPTRNSTAATLQRFSASARVNVVRLTSLAPKLALH